MSNENALATFKGLSTLLRPRYTRGLLLEDDDLTAAVEYTRNSVRLLFRSLFGCGVICGLGVTPTVLCNSRQLQVTVKKGVALDCLGNPIEIPGDRTLLFDADCKPLPAEIWVSVCYLEKNCRPKDVSCSPEEDAHVVQTRSHDGFEIKLHSQQPAGSCSCAPPAPNGGNGGNGGTSSGKCCSEGESTTSVTTNAADDPCACYAKHEAGDCDCDCDCSCVVIAKISIDPNMRYADGKVLIPDLSVRRVIRPLLLGQVKCRQPQPTPLPQGTADRADDAGLPVRVSSAEEPEAELKVDAKRPQKTEALKTESVKTDSLKTEAAKVEAAKVEASKAKPKGKEA